MTNILNANMLECVGIDDWNRAIFRHVVTGKYYCMIDILYNEDEEEKAINDLKSKKYELDCKLYGFDSEPDCPVKYDFW